MIKTLFLLQNIDLDLEVMLLQFIIFNVNFCAVFIKVDETTYRTTIEHINGLFDEAESIGCCNAMEGCLACLTGFATHYCFKTHYERVS